MNLFHKPETALNLTVAGMRCPLRSNEKDRSGQPESCHIGHHSYKKSGKGARITPERVIRSSDGGAVIETVLGTADE